MQIKISLPSPNNSNTSTYSEIKGYLKQLELAVHHAQKAVESYKKDTGIEKLSEDSYITLEPVYLGDCLQDDAKKAIDGGETIKFVENLSEIGIDDYYEQKQYIDLIIELVPIRETEKEAKES